MDDMEQGFATVTALDQWYQYQLYQDRRDAAVIRRWLHGADRVLERIEARRKAAKALPLRQRRRVAQALTRRGYSVEKIAREFGLAPSTVRGYLKVENDLPDFDEFSEA